MGGIDPFVVRLLVSFVVGGVWITLTSVAAETFGSRIGGFLGGLPSTIVVALTAIGWTQGAERAYHATTALPLAFGVNCVFLLVYAALVHRGMALGLGGALGAWGALQAILVWRGVSHYGLALLGWAVMLVGAYVLMVRVLRVRPHERVAVRRGRWDIPARAVLSGGIIVLAVALSNVGGPVLGAVMAAFPAVYVSTLAITARSVSVAFSRSLVVPLMVSAVVNCVVFGTAYRYTVLDVGLVGAAAAGYGAALVSAAGTYWFLRRRAA
jgi:hypothetical protein